MTEAKEVSYTTHCGHVKFRPVMNSSTSHGVLEQDDCLIAKNIIYTIELFAGAGGLAQGFERAGCFETAALYDISEATRDAYIAYRPQATYHCLDVDKLEREDVLSDLDGRPLQGILGGPPCQGFSMAGKRLSHADINKLIHSYARKVEVLEPRFLVFENVPQLIFHELFRPLLDMLMEAYYVVYGVLNAAHYGTPQTRHRLILIAYHKDLGVKPTLPNATHGKLGQRLYAYNLTDSQDRVELNGDTAKSIFGADPVIGDYLNAYSRNIDNAPKKGLAPLVTVGDAISDLSSGDGSDAVPYATEARTSYQLERRGEFTEVMNCQHRKHVGRPLEIAENLREGGTPSKEPGDLYGRYYSQAYARLHRDALARTLTTFFMNAGSGRFLHYEQPRTLTVREAARLQGFDDEFVFVGSLQDQMTAVGNAVPLPLAEALGQHVLGQIGHLI